MPTLACDIGGTVIKVGVVEGARLLARRSIDARSEEGLAARLPAIREALEQVAREAGTAPGDCRGVFVAMPGIIDVRAARVVSVHQKYTDAPTVDLRAWGAGLWGLPLRVENDARAALVGEWRAGAGRGADDLVMVTLGTGIGTAVLTGGRLLRGPHGTAGNLGGHLTVDVDGRACTCGNIGCAEAEASQSVLADLVAARPGYAASPLAATDPLDYRAVFDLAAAGDPTAASIARRSLDVWAALAVTLVHAYDPDRLVVGGGIARAEPVVPTLRQHVARHAWTPDRTVDVVPARLGDDAALLAAEWALGAPDGH
ncbi:MAG: ROK family protein [Acidimicrobiales bacterium]|nr:ROK family protein [Acidimicrobiales bacterium]